MKTIIIVMLILMSTVTYLTANDIREVYYAKLGTHDHYSSRGTRLNTVSAILRQDRANYHKFYKRDRYDTDDKFFSSKRNREEYERMMTNTNVSRRTREEILYGTPKIKVII